MGVHSSQEVVLTASHIHIRCPDCATPYRVKRGLVPDSGARAACKTCGGSLVFRPVRRATVWVFTDDPAIRRGDTLRQLERLDDLDVLFLDASDRSDLVDLPGAPLPDAVVFGDMHVLLEDALLRRCCDGGAARLLLSTHGNEELREMADASFGFDHHLHLPIDLTVLRAVFADLELHPTPAS